MVRLFFFLARIRRECDVHEEERKRSEQMEDRKRELAMKYGESPGLGSDDGGEWEGYNKRKGNGKGFGGISNVPTPEKWSWADDKPSSRPWDRSQWGGGEDPELSIRPARLWPDDRSSSNCGGATSSNGSSIKTKIS